MTAEHSITVRKLTGNIGAEISGIDLRETISEADAAALRDCLALYQVIFFRAQHLDLQQQKTLTRCIRTRPATALCHTHGRRAGDHTGIQGR